MAKQFAIRLSLIAFAVGVIEALVAGDAFTTGLTSAGVKAICSYGIGLFVGHIAQRIVEENAAAEFGLEDVAALHNIPTR